MDTRIRMATTKDAKEINAIYEKYVLETAYTFEYDPVPLKEFRDRIAGTIQKLPYLVCETDGKIAGYAYLGPFHTRAAFGWDVEITVYLHPDYYRRNIGTALYEALFEIAKELGYVNIIADITMENEKSCKMHEHLGFEQVGCIPSAGYKFGKWWGLCIMCKTIGDTKEKPQRIKNIHELEQNELDHILENATNMIRA